MSCVKTVEPIEVQFGMLSREHVLHENADTPGTFGV